MARDGVFTVLSTVRFADGTTDLGTVTYSETTEQKTAAARTRIINTIAAKINDQKALLTTQQAFVAAQCEFIRNAIQEAI